jgi:hypothetical protein
MLRAIAVAAVLSSGCSFATYHDVTAAAADGCQSGYFPAVADAGAALALGAGSTLAWYIPFNAYANDARLDRQLPSLAPSIVLAAAAAVMSGPSIYGLWAAHSCLELAPGGRTQPTAAGAKRRTSSDAVAECIRSRGIVACAQTAIAAGVVYAGMRELDVERSWGPPTEVRKESSRLVSWRYIDGDGMRYVLFDSGVVTSVSQPRN